MTNHPRRDWMGLLARAPADRLADRLAAPPGSRVYGIPSVKARWYCDVEAAGSIGTFAAR